MYGKTFILTVVYEKSILFYVNHFLFHDDFECENHHDPIDDSQWKEKFFIDSGFFNLPKLHKGNIFPR